MPYHFTYSAFNVLYPHAGRDYNRLVWVDINVIQLILLVSASPLSNISHVIGLLLLPNVWVYRVQVLRFGVRYHMFVLGVTFLCQVSHSCARWHILVSGVTFLCQVAYSCARPTTNPPPHPPLQSCARYHILVFMLWGEANSLPGWWLAAGALTRTLHD